MGDPGPAAILRVSLPDGAYFGVDPDPWLDEGWVLNITGTTETFALRINNTSGSLVSYDTHLIVALNNASYNNFVELSINSTAIPKTSFQYGKPRPYDLWNWPSGDIYPAWFSDIYIVGTIDSKGYRDLSVSVVFSNVTGVRMHFDAYGSEVLPPPTKVGDITHVPISGDSTVIFWPSVEEQYYLTVETDPPGVSAISGEDWYASSTNVTLTAPTPVPNLTGVQYRFDYWEVDENVTAGNPIVVHMDANHTATAHYVTQYYLTLETSPPSITTPAGEGWFDNGTYASISTPQHINITAGSSRYRFANWTTADMDEITNASSPSTTVLIDKPKTVAANYVTQYNVTFDQTGVDTDFTGIVIIVDGTGYGVADLPKFFWWNVNSVHDFSFQSPLIVTVNVKRYVWLSTSGLSSLQTDTITVLTSGDVTGNYETQYYLTITSTIGGTTNPVPGNYPYAAGTITNVTAIPNVDYDFGHWELDGFNAGTSNPIAVTMDDAHSLEAIFVKPPIASFTESPVTPLVGQQVTFDASASQPGFDGSSLRPITEYRWDFNGDNIIDLTTSNPIATYNYTQAGFYTVTLTVYAPSSPEGSPQYVPLGEATHIKRVVLPVGGHLSPIERSRNLLLYSINSIYIYLVLLLTIFLGLVLMNRVRRILGQFSGKAKK